MSNLLPQFRKQFFFKWSYNKWEKRFLALSPIKQRGLLAAMDSGVRVWFAYDRVVKLDENDLYLRFDATIEFIWIDQIDSTFAM